VDVFRVVLLSRETSVHEGDQHTLWVRR
jgi:hypothetical protein